MHVVAVMVTTINKKNIQQQLVVMAILVLYVVSGVSAALHHCNIVRRLQRQLSLLWLADVRTSFGAILRVVHSTLLSLYDDMGCAMRENNPNPQLTAVLL